MYTSPIAHIAQAHGIQQQQYADDTQLYLVLSPNSMVTHVPALESCLESLQAWFCANNMTLNAINSNAILFATSQRSQLLSKQVSVNISGDIDSDAYFKRSKVHHTRGNNMKLNKSHASSVRHSHFFTHRVINI